MNNMVHSRRAVLQVAEDLGFEDVDDLLLRRWVRDAEREIGGKYTYLIERHVLHLKDQLYATLPCEVYEVLALFTGEVGNDCSLYYGNNGPTGFDPVYSIQDLSSEIGITVITGSDYKGFSVLDYSVINNKIQFSCEVTGYDKVTAYVMRYQTDDKGYIMVAEDHLSAITYYVGMKIAERSMFHSRPMAANNVQYWYKRWNQEKSLARAATAQMTESERASLADIVHNPLTGRVYEYGRFTQHIY